MNVISNHVITLILVLVGSLVKKFLKRLKKMLSNTYPTNKKQAEHWYWFYHQIHLIVSFWFVKKSCCFWIKYYVSFSNQLRAKNNKSNPFKRERSEPVSGVPKASILHAPKSNLYHWSQATDRLGANHNQLVCNKFGLPVHRNVARWLVVDLLMYIQQHMTVPQNGVVAPARKSQDTNWRPQRRLWVSEKCISSVRSLGYAPDLKFL